MNKWDEVFGSIDFEKFSPEQQTELRKGLELGLPMQMYANPDFTAEEIADLRGVLEKTAYAHRDPDQEYNLENLFCGFRSETNFKLHPDRICYIPENWDFDDGFGYTGNDFLALCDGNIQKAQALFDQCEWQHPETILDENEREEALENDIDTFLVESKPSLSDQIQSAATRSAVQFEKIDHEKEQER